MYEILVLGNCEEVTARVIELAGKHTDGAVKFRIGIAALYVEI